MSDMNDEQVTDESGIWTQEFDTWIRKSLLVDWSRSKMYVRRPDGELLPVTSVRIDRQADLRFGYGDLSETFCAEDAFHDRGEEAPAVEPCRYPLGQKGECVNLINHVSKG